MGLFDNVLKSVDGALKAVESGELEKKLNALADAVDKGSKTATDKVASVATAPEDIANKVKSKKEVLERTADRARQGAREVNDIIRQTEK